MHESRSILSQFESNGNTLVGYAAVWDSPAQINENGRSFTEVIRRGAFRSAVESKADVIVSFNHDTNRLLGRTASGTARIHEDDRGLRFEVDLPEHASDVKEMVSRGDLRGASFTFSVRKGGEKWDGNVRQLTDLYLVEVGAVVMPAYRATSVGLRSLDNYKLKLKCYEKSQGKV